VASRSCPSSLLVTRCFYETLGFRHLLERIYLTARGMQACLSPLLPSPRALEFRRQIHTHPPRSQPHPILLAHVRTGIVSVISQSAPRRLPTQQFGSSVSYRSTKVVYILCALTYCTNCSISSSCTDNGFSGAPVAMFARICFCRADGLERIVCCGWRRGNSRRIRRYRERTRIVGDSDAMLMVFGGLEMDDLTTLGIEQYDGLEAHETRLG